MSSPARAAPSPRRLLFVAGSAHPLGGLMTWLDYVLPGLRERGWEPVLGLVEGPRHHRPERLVASHPVEPWIRIPCATGTPEGRRRAIMRALTVQRPAVALGVNIPDLFPAIHAARRAGGSTRGLMTVHAIEPELYADAFRFRGTLDGVVATNRLACRLLTALSGIAAERVFYAPYGVEEAPREPHRAPANERTAPRDGGPLRIGFAGRIERSQKRVFDLPAIAAALERMGVRHEWRIAGSGPEESALRREMPAGTAFLGAVEASRISPLLYERIDALVVPSRWETGPLVAWEAMAAGIPVVASRYVGSGLENALRDGDNALLFEIGDAEGAARHLARLRREPGLARRLAEGGGALLRERYGRRLSLDAWERALEGALRLTPLAASTDPAVPPASGRLERWAGARWAEDIRQALGRTGPDAGSGGEWPHAYGPAIPREEFYRRAEELDRCGNGRAC